MINIRPGAVSREDLHALAGAVVTILRNPGLATKLGRRGYERLHRHYTLARCLERYDELITELISRGRT